jgi:hypothetical protein
MLRNDCLPKVEINKPGRRKFGGPVWEGSVEGALMMIIAVRGWLILAANIDNGVTGLQEIRIPGSDECGGLVGGQQAEHVDGESFVSVEMAIVGADGER